MLVDPTARPWVAVDGPSLVQAAAALQLVPENRPAYLRLQRLVAIGAGLPIRGNVGRLSPSGLRQALQRPPVEEVLRNEDPPEDLFTCDVPFHGGPQLTIEGLCTEAGQVAGRMLRAIFTPHENLLPEEFRRDASLLATVLLRISDLVCRRAGLYRGQMPGTKMRAKVFVPGREALERLSRTVLLTPTELGSLLPTDAIGVVHDLALTPRAVDSSTPAPDENALVVRPFLKLGEDLIVANPAELSGSLRHNLITLAQRHGCVEELAVAIRRQVTKEAAITLRLFGMRPLTPVETTPDPLIIRQRFEFADDKFLDLAILTDDLRGYSADDPFGVWSVPDLSQRLREVVDSAGDSDPKDPNTLRLILQEPLGRSYTLGLMSPRRDGPIMMARPAELEVIGVLDGADPLALWRFAQADDRLHETTRVLSFSTLDRYGLYRKNDYSFYLSDDRRPDSLHISTDYALPLKAEAYRKVGAHEVPSPRRPAFIQVVSMHGTDNAPIYFVHPRHEEDERLVELSGLHVWVGADAETGPRLRGFVNEIANAAAYWTWQLSLHVPGFLQGSSGDRLRVELAIDDEEAWVSALAGSTDEGADGTWISASDSTLGRAKLCLYARGARSLFSQRNEADRLLVAALATALADATGIGLERLASIVDTVAPIGRKKVIRTNTRADVLLRPGTFRAARLVQPAVTAVVLDQLGDWLAEVGYSVGVIPDADRTTILGKCVDYYFKRIQAEVGQLDPDGLIEYLVNHDEAKLHADALERQSLAYRLACFGESPELTEEIARSERKRTEAAIASRFLVEYVAATPPSGTKKISLDVYDHLLALAAEIYARATLSDAIHYRFSDAKLSVLESKRLGTSRGDRYEIGTGAFGQAQAEAIRRMAIETDSAPKEAATSPSMPSSAIESAILAEFGFTLADLAAGIAELIRLGDDICSEEPCRLPRPVVEQRLRDSLEWEDNKISKFVDNLSLRPRRNFLSVGADAYPWRYNREWSYLRRPLVQLDGSRNSQELVWGNRRLWSAGEYWLNLIYSGRMRAKTSELRRVVSTIRQEENSAFEQSVADAFGRGGCSLTAARLSKVDGKKLQSSNGDDLGDIDAIGICVDRRLVFVGEAKDFELARIPRELAHEADNLLYGDRSALRKLTGRAQWVRQNLQSAIKHFKLDADLAGWTVEPVIVTSRDLISPRLLESDVPVIAIDQVERFIQGKVSRARRPQPNRSSTKRRR